MVDLQGQAAALNGISTEKKVSDIVEKFGAKTIKYNELEKNLNEDTLLIKNWPYKGLYGGDSKGDFYLSSKKLNQDISIEVRSQKVAGTVDQKFPFLYLDCLGRDTHTVIIVLAGDGARQGALDWLYRAAADTSSKNLKVMYLDEFERYMKEIFDRGIVC